MNKIRLFWLFVILTLLAMTSCREEFDDHYNSVGDASIGKNVTQVLKERDGFTLFLQMIQRADLERTLSESGLYTCIAPKDADVQAFLDENGFTVETMPLQTLIRYVNYHFISGMWYLYNFEKNYEGYKDDYTYRRVYTVNTMQQTRSDDNNPPKWIRIFTPSYFAARAYDYKSLRGSDGDDFMVEGARISKTERDIPTSNGVIHVLEDRLLFAPRADEAIAKDPELSIMMKWFDRFVSYEYKKPTASGEVDTTRIKHYDVATEKSDAKMLDIAEEKSYYTFIAPTDAAIHEALDPYMTPELLGSYDEMPDRFVIQILRSLVGTSYYLMSDITRNDPYFFTSGGAILPFENDIAAMISGSLLSSNATIFKMNKMPVIPILQSVEAGLYIKAKKYKEWQKMIENKKLDPYGVGFCGTDYNSYQHQPKTILIQPDDAQAWVNPTGNGMNGVDGFPSQFLDTLGWNMKAGLLEANVKDGNFEHKFYRTAYGYLLYEDGKFTDYQGHEVPLISKESTWTGSNGAFYEIDGFFNALLTRTTIDTMEFIYRKYLEEDSEYSTLRTLIEKAEMKKTLDSYGTAFYTLFAPTNAAFAASSEYNLDKINGMEKGEAQNLLYRHLVGSRRIFTDGQTSGPISSLTGTTLNISGAWDDFRIRTQYGGTSVISERANRQASNGVVHGVSNVITQ